MFVEHTVENHIKIYSKILINVFVRLIGYGKDILKTIHSIQHKT